MKTKVLISHSNLLQHASVRPESFIFKSEPFSNENSAVSGRELVKKTLMIISVFFIFFGCQFSFQNIEYKRAEKAFQNKNYEQAVKHYSRVIKRKKDKKLSLESARKASQLSLFHLKDYTKAIEYFKFLVLYSPDERERKKSQEKIAEIFFNKLTDYKKSIEEYNKLLKLPHSMADDFNYRFYLAKSYYYLNNFYQSKVEVDYLLAKELKNEQKFQLGLFKANIYLTNKELEEALKIFTQLEKEHPKLSMEEKVALNISVCYEEMRDFDKAINTLERVKNNYDLNFIELKIKRLQQRKQNLPGAHGFKK